MSIDREISDQNMEWRRSLTIDFKYLHLFFMSEKMSLKIKTARFFEYSITLLVDEALITLLNSDEKAAKYVLSNYSLINY